MEIDSPAGPSTFRPTPALGVTYVLDVDEEDVKIIPVLPLPLIDDPNDEGYDPHEDQDIDEDDDPEGGPPYPTPSSIVRGKRKATEIYDVNDEADAELRQYGQLRRKKARLGGSRREPEYIYISSDSDDGHDITEIPKPEPEKKVKHEYLSPEPQVAAVKEESMQDEEPLDESPDPSPEAETGSVERVRPNIPNWLEVQLAKSRKQHPSAKLEICYHYSIDGDVWQVKCNACPRTCCVGPGQSLVHLHRHLGGAAHKAAAGINTDAGSIPRASAGAGSSNGALKVEAKAASRWDPDPPHPDPRRPAPALPATPTGRHVRTGARADRDGREGDGDGDDVERFLDQLGLSVDLAPKLRLFGFVDDRRMNMMGRLSDESLGLLLEHLTKQGVDLVTAIVVREGLKRRAGTL